MKSARVEIAPVSPITKMFLAGFGIYSKAIRPIQKSVSEPIRVIPNKSEASFNPYQSEAHSKSTRTLNPNESDQSESVQTINPNES